MAPNRSGEREHDHWLSFLLSPSGGWRSIRYLMRVAPTASCTRLACRGLMSSTQRGWRPGSTRRRAIALAMRAIRTCIVVSFPFRCDGSCRELRAARAVYVCRPQVPAARPSDNPPGELSTYSPRRLRVERGGFEPSGTPKWVRPWVWGGAGNEESRPWGGSWKRCAGGRVLADRHPGVPRSLAASKNAHGVARALARRHEIALPICGDEGDHFVSPFSSKTSKKRRNAPEGVSRPGSNLA